MGFRLSKDDAWDLVARAHTGIVTTLRRDGRPVSVPVWHVVLDGAVWVQTPPSTKKLARIRNDDRAHVLVEEGRAWAELRSVSFEARAAIVDDGQAALDAIAAKYADFQPPMEKLPEAVRSYYSDFRVVRLDPVGRLHSFNNRALVSGAAD